MPLVLQRCSAYLPEEEQFLSSQTPLLGTGTPCADRQHEIFHSRVSNETGKLVTTLLVFW